MVALPVLFWLASCLLLIFWFKERKEALRELSSRMESFTCTGNVDNDRQSSDSPERTDRERGPSLTSRRLLGNLTPLSSRLPFPVEKELLRQARCDLSPEELQSLRLIALIVLCLFFLMSSGPLALPLLLTPLILLTWILPIILLKRRVRRNHAAILNSLPTLLDLLSLLLLSGQNIHAALLKASAACEGPLRYEIDQAFRAMEMGVTRQQALSRLEERIPVVEIRRFVRSIMRAERFGVPLSDVIVSLAAEMRRERRARLEEMAHKAPVKMLFPLVFLILPSFLLLIVGGMLLGSRVF